jgi:hypothetical protein
MMVAVIRSGDLLSPPPPAEKATTSEERAVEALAQTGDLYRYHEPKVLAPAFD